MIRGVYTPSLELQRTPFRLYTLEDADINIICDPVDFKIQLTSSYWINMHLSLNIKSYLYSNHAQNWCTQLNIPFIDQFFSNIPNWRSKFCSFARHLADCVRSGDLKRMEVIDGTGWSNWNPKLTSSNILTYAAYPPGNCAHIPSNQGTQENPWFFTFFPVLVGYVIVSWRVFPKPKQPSCQTTGGDERWGCWVGTLGRQRSLWGGPCSWKTTSGQLWDLYIPYF